MLNLSHLSKTEARLSLRQISRSLPTEYFLQAGQEICKTVLCLSQYRQANTVFCYVSTQKEPFTMPFLVQALQEGKQVAVPKSFSNGKMIPCHINSLEQLSPGRFGILEPPDTAPVISPKEIDFSLIPCVGLSLSGQRMGQGGGYYDRFLPTLSSPFIGCCASALLCESLPTEPHDIKLPLIVTEKMLLFSH